MADYEKHRPDVVIASAHGQIKKESGCPAQLCPFGQKWSYVHCQCVKDDHQPFEQQMFDKYIIPGQSSVLTPHQAKWPCATKDKHKLVGGQCVCKPVMCLQGYHQDDQSCECITNCPGENVTWSVDQDKCICNDCAYGKFLDKSSCSCCDTPCSTSLPKSKKEIASQMLKILHWMFMKATSVSSAYAGWVTVKASQTKSWGPTGFQLQVNSVKYDGNGKFDWGGSTVNLIFYVDSENGLSDIKKCAEKWDAGAAKLSEKPAVDEPPFSLKDTWWDNIADKHSISLQVGNQQSMYGSGKSYW